MASDHSSVTLNILLSQSPGCQTAPRMQKLITNVCIKINLFLTIINLLLMRKKTLMFEMMFLHWFTWEQNSKQRQKLNFWDKVLVFATHQLHDILFMNTENLFNSSLRVCNVHCRLHQASQFWISTWCWTLSRGSAAGFQHLHSV